jgi:hypothetical protein
MLEHQEAGCRRRSKTPDYRGQTRLPTQRMREWYKVEVVYDTDPEWVDEISFTYYVVVKAKQPHAGSVSVYALQGRCDLHQH